MACDARDALQPHRPRLARVCNTAPPRELLGYPAGFVASTLGDAQAAAVARLAPRTPAELVQRIGDAALPLAERLACGTLLAWHGDPRLDPGAPAMCDVAGGTVQIGLPAEAVARTQAAWADLGVEAAWIRKEVPRHTRHLAPYRIGRFPVTHVEYRAFLTHTGWPSLPSSWRLGRYPHEAANHPVHGVTPADAEAYAAWSARATGRRLRLPTEAEWEHAAAGPQGREFPWGDCFEPARTNTAELGLLGTSPVGAFPGGAAACGALDMAGNVEELVADAYAPYPGGRVVEDDLFRLDPNHRIARGGSFARFADLARTRRRHGAIFDNEVYVMGFRLAEDIT